MACKYRFGTRDDRITKMAENNPSKPVELVISAVDGIWDEKRKSILDAIPDRYSGADIQNLGDLSKEIMETVDQLFLPPSKDNDVVGMIFSGPAGSGKTYAAYAVIKFLAEHNPEMVACMVDYPEMMHKLRQEFAKDSFDELGSMWDQLRNDSGLYKGLLFVDDLSSVKPTDFELDKILMFLNERVNNYMPFLFTTNVDPEDFLSVFGDRIDSRLRGYAKVVLFDAIDRRITPIL